MKRIILALLAALVATPTSALNLTSVPPKFNIPWGNSASAPYINYTVPQASQIGVTNCAASLTDGFPPLTFVPSGSGGCQPFGKDYNGIFKQITLWNQWQGAGATLLYDSSFSTAISGYPRGAFLSQSATAGCFWVNTSDGNTSNPDSGGTLWTSTCPGGGIAVAAAGGTANALTVATTPVRLVAGQSIWFLPASANTGATTIALNGGSAVAVVRQAPGGLSALTGGELQPMWQQVIYDGTQYELVTSGAFSYLSAPDQTLTGGANVVSLGGTSTSFTVDCGLRPLQWIPITSAITITAPLNDGSCMLQLENGVGAAIPIFTGFTTGPNTGDPLTTTNGSKFVVTIWRIHGTSSFIVKAMQ
jgi:hypothetical protein